MRWNECRRLCRIAFAVPCQIGIWAPALPAWAQYQSLPEIVVTASPTGIGTADTASQGVVTPEQLHEFPAYRPGELLETVPGLIVAQHSGEGKANQYFMRGFNL